MVEAVRQAVERCYSQPSQEEIELGEVCAGNNFDIKR